MKRRMSVLLLSGVFISSLMMFQNCSNVSFTPEQPPDLASSANAAANENGADPTCRTDVVTASADVKVLFMVDASGSNNNDGGQIGTDDGQVWRLKTLNSFVDTYQNKNNFFYGLLTFQDNSAKPQINTGGAGIFTNNLTMVRQGIANFDANIDSGSTPYLAALNLAKSMIVEDLKVVSSKPVAYVVVMISDGVPKDSRYTAKNGVANLSADVKALMDLAPGKISVNSVMLYNVALPTNSDKQYLQAMATAGNGIFTLADANKTLVIGDSLSVPKVVCQ